jgi:hypothetical protein
VDGVARGTPALDAAGRATLAITLHAGTHTVVASYNGNNNYNGSTRALTQRVVTANRSFVYQVYRDLLRREPDPTGLANWTARLDTGAPRSAVAQAILSSTEYLTLSLADLYRQYLHRPIDPRGLTRWLQVLHNPTQYAGNGNVVEYVKAQLLGSLEYFNLHGATNAGFLDGLWRDVLGRPIDPAALADFSNRLAHGATRASVALTVTSSLEARQGLVRSFYLRFLHRPADPNGLASFVNLLATQHTDNLVITGLIGSLEYFNNL